MTHDDRFNPETVDEQVDNYSLFSSAGPWPYSQRGGHPQAISSLVGDLKGYYQVERREDGVSLERVWKRISARASEANKQQQSPLINHLQASQERVPIMRSVSRGENLGRRLSLLVAALVAIILVGGLVVVLNATRHINTGATGSGTKRTSTMTAAAPGQTLYTTPPNQWGFESLAWSPDSKRIASATSNDKGVQIWDATTGDHLVTVTLSSDNSEWAYGLNWSPNSDKLVVGTNKELLIVDGQTGKIISRHLANVPIAMSGTASGQSYNGMSIPASGGFGFRAVSWSPDGQLIADALSFGVNGELEVWNFKTGATDFTFTLSGSYNLGALAWSSDGQYIAASTWNTQPADPIQPYINVMVWSVSTHQVVFQHSDYMGTGAPIAWQPQSHNLAFVGATSSKGNLISTLEIWNAATGKPVKQLVGVATGAVAWSPDGDQLAYADFGNTVVIIDAATDKQVYVYRGHHQFVSVVAWSPNGKYIVSGEDNSQSDMVAKVWTA